MSVVNEFIKGYMRGIQIAYLVLQLIITILVWHITNYIVYAYGKPDKDFNFAMSLLVVLALLIYISKIIFQLYEYNKGE